MSPVPKIRCEKSIEPPDDALFDIKKRKAVPHEFVLDALAPLPLRTNPMFGCLAVYVGGPLVPWRQNLDGVQPGVHERRPAGDRERGATKAIAMASFGVDVKFGRDLGVFQLQKI